MRRGEIAHNVSRGAFFLALEKAAALFSGIAYFALMLRWLGPTKYGMLTLALAIIGLATMVTGNFEVFLERFAAEYEARRRLDVLERAHRFALGLKFALGLLASILLVALAPHLGVQFRTPELATLLPLLTLIVATDGLATTGRAMLYGLQKFEWVSGLSLIFHIGKTLLVGALWWMREGLHALAIGLSLLTALQAVVMCAASFIMLRRMRERHPVEPAEAAASPEPTRSLLRPMIAYCAPLLGARAAFLSGQNLGKVVLGKVLSATELGYYSFAFQTVERFVELVHTLPAALLPSLTHLVAREERERLRNVFDQAFRLIQLVACALAFGLFVFAPELTLWVGSPLFAPAIPLLRVLALVPIARTAQQPLTMLFQAMRRPGLVLTLALLKFAVEIGCYLLLVPAYGKLGAGWANLAGAVFSYAVALALLAVAIPEGASERLTAVVRNVALLAPGLLLALAADRFAGPHVSPWLRLALVAPGLLGTFALGLITRYDLEKLSTLPLRAPWLKSGRDVLVRGADRLARAFEPRRAA